MRRRIQLAVMVYASVFVLAGTAPCRNHCRIHRHKYHNYSRDGAIRHDAERRAV